MTDNGWDEYKKLVLHELERSNSRLQKIEDHLNVIDKKLTILQTKVYTTALLISVVISGLIQYAGN
jgi:hypothetical protein